jgi:pantoate--beta-alanine ligase
MQRLARRWRAGKVRVGLVPTMGGLHEGHLSLIRRARRVVGASGRVVASVFVNPTQFGAGEDFAKYPRDLARDKRLCREAGVDFLFVPREIEMYPQQVGAEFSTWVSEESLSRRMEGGSRPSHFRGVTTVVAKLFNIVLPDIAVFGAKDWQQAAIVRRMVRDLNFPLKIVVAPLCREPDGLAFSSRNRYLDADRRRQAVVLWHALQRARRAVRQAKRPLSGANLRREVTTFIQRQPDARVEYVEFFEPATLQPVRTVESGTQMAVAVVVGKTRLIDNARL